MSNDGVEAKVRKVVTCLVHSEEVIDLVKADKFDEFVSKVCKMCDSYDLETIKAPKRKVLTVLWYQLGGALSHSGYINYIGNLATIFQWPWAKEHSAFLPKKADDISRKVAELQRYSTVQRLVMQHRYPELVQYMLENAPASKSIARMKVRTMLWSKLEGRRHAKLMDELDILCKQQWEPAVAVKSHYVNELAFTTCNAPPFKIERWNDGSLKAFEVDDNCKLSVMQEATLRSLKAELAHQVGCETATGRMSSTMPSFQELPKSHMELRPKTYVEYYLNKGETAPKLQVDGSYTTGSNRGKGGWFEYFYGDELHRTQLETEESLVQAIWGKAREARKRQGFGMSYGSSPSNLLGFKAINFDDLETRLIAVAGGADSTYDDRVWGSSYPAMLLGLASLGQSFGSDQANKLSKGNIMSTKAYQSITTNYVYGVDITTMNDQQLIAAIKRAKTEKNTLSDVSESKKVQGMMKDIDDAIVKMTEALDAKS